MNVTQSHFTRQQIAAQLILIWSDALRVSPDTIQVDIPFVSIGGDSLSAMLCISRIRSAFSRELDLVDFFSERSSIQDFAIQIAGSE